MSGTGISDVLGKLSEAIVLIDPADQSALVGIQRDLREISGMAGSAEEQQLAAAAEAAARLLEDLLNGKLDESGESLDVVAATISALQHIVDGGQSPGSVEFPAGLHLTDDHVEAAPPIAPAHAEPSPQVDDATAEELAADEVTELTGDPELLADFVSEAMEHLDNVDAQLLTLDDHPDDSEALNAVFRVFHTIKGVAGFLELSSLQRLAHDAETMLDAARSGSLKLVGEALELTFGANDALRRMIQGVEHALNTDQKLRSDPAVPGLQRRLGAVVSSPQEPTSDSEALPAASGSAEPEPAESEPAEPEPAAEFVAEAREHLDDVDAQLLTLEDNPTDVEALNAVFRAFHTLKGSAGFLELDAVQDFAHEAESLLEAARSGSVRLAGEALELTFEANDALRRMVAEVERTLGTSQQLTPDPTVAALQHKIASVAARGQEPAMDSAKQPAQPPERAKSAEQPKQDAGARRTGGNAYVRETIKVDADRLNELVDTIGELVIAEAMVSQSEEWATEESSRLPSLLSQMDKITRELQQMAMSMRMVPIRSTFQRMARLARDVAKKVNKQMRFSVHGEDTELDKTVVDAIGDPLVHMVRNSIDHGLETPEERRRAGKPELGHVELRAFHRGGSIYIEIEDDGRGLDREAILAKAAEKGLVREGEKLTDGEVYLLLFAPGFSTAKTVTDVSGRGVGLDVVKRGIEALRGRVEIRSELGKGSVFSLRLPLTLAIIEGMVIRVAEQRYVIPTLSIVRMMQPTERDLSQVFDRADLLSTGDRQLPLYRLDKLFKVPGAIQDMTQASVVIVEQDEREYALLVDELVGQQQIVIKPLGDQLAGTQGFAGGAIMPDGRVALILDIGGVVKIAAAGSKEGPIAPAVTQAC